MPITDNWHALVSLRGSPPVNMLLQNTTTGFHLVSSIDYHYVRAPSTSTEVVSGSLDADTNPPTVLLLHVD